MWPFKNTKSITSEYNQEWMDNAKESLYSGYGRSGLSDNIYENWKKQRDIQVVQNEDVMTKDALEKMAKMMSEMSQARDPYEVAESAMNSQLEKKGLPDMETILKSFKETNPEYFV